MKQPFFDYIERLFLGRISVNRDHATVIYQTPRVRVIRFVEWRSLAAALPHLSVQRPHRGVEDGRLLFVRVYPVTVLVAWAGAQ